MLLTKSLVVQMDECTHGEGVVVQGSIQNAANYSKKIRIEGGAWPILLP